MCVCVCVCMYVRVCIYVCMYERVCVCVCVLIYIIIRASLSLYEYSEYYSLMKTIFTSIRYVANTY